MPAPSKKWLGVGQGYRTVKGHARLYFPARTLVTSEDPADFWARHGLTDTGADG